MVSASYPRVGIRAFQVIGSESSVWGQNDLVDLQVVTQFPVRLWINTILD